MLGDNDEHDYREIEDTGKSSSTETNEGKSEGGSTSEKEEVVKNDGKKGDTNSTGTPESKATDTSGTGQKTGAEPDGRGASGGSNSPERPDKLQVNSEGGNKGSAENSATGTGSSKAEPHRRGFIFQRNRRKGKTEEAKSS